MKTLNKLKSVAVIGVLVAMGWGAVGADGQRGSSKASSKQGSAGVVKESNGTASQGSGDWPTTPDFSKIHVVYAKHGNWFVGTQYNQMNQWRRSWDLLSGLSTTWAVYAGPQPKPSLPWVIYYQSDTEGKGEKAAKSFQALLVERYGVTGRPEAFSVAKGRSNVRSCPVFPDRVLKGVRPECTPILWVPGGTSPDDFSATSSR